MNVCVTAPDLKAIIKQNRSNKDGQAALLHILVSTESECFGLKGVTLILKQLMSQVRVGKTDPTKTADHIRENWDCYNRVKRKRPLDTTTVAAFTVTALCDDPLYANLLILHPDMDDVIFADLKVIVMNFYWAYIKQRKSLYPLDDMHWMYKILVMLLTWYLFFGWATFTEMLLLPRRGVVSQVQGMSTVCGD